MTHYYYYHQLATNSTDWAREDSPRYIVGHQSSVAGWAFIVVTFCEHLLSFTGFWIGNITLWYNWQVSHSLFETKTLGCFWRRGICRDLHWIFKVWTFAVLMMFFKKNNNDLCNIFSVLFIFCLKTQKLILLQFFYYDLWIYLVQNFKN